MSRLELDDMLEALIVAFDRDIAPHVQIDDDGYTASLCRTFGQLLRAARARALAEPAALRADRDELVALFERYADDLSAADRDVLREAADGGPGSPPAQLAAQVGRLRAVAAALSERLADPCHPARRELRAHTARSLEREAPWMVDAFVGPRR